VVAWTGNRLLLATGGALVVVTTGGACLVVVGGTVVVVVGGTVVVVVGGACLVVVGGACLVVVGGTVVVVVGGTVVVVVGGTVVVVVGGTVVVVVGGTGATVGTGVPVGGTTAEATLADGGPAGKLLGEIGPTTSTPLPDKPNALVCPPDCALAGVASTTAVAKAMVVPPATRSRSARRVIRRGRNAVDAQLFTDSLLGPWSPCTAGV